MTREKAARVLIVATIFLSAALAAGAAEPSEEERVAIFEAAGFEKKGDGYVHCDQDVTMSYAPGRIEMEDVNGDGSRDAWVKESSVFCYGNTAEFFVLVTRQVGGGWVNILEAEGVPTGSRVEEQGLARHRSRRPGLRQVPRLRLRRKEVRLEEIAGREARDQLAGAIGPAAACDRERHEPRAPPARSGRLGHVDEALAPLAREGDHVDADAQRAARERRLRLRHRHAAGEIEDHAERLARPHTVRGRRSRFALTRKSSTNAGLASLPPGNVGRRAIGRERRGGRRSRSTRSSPAGPNRRSRRPRSPRRPHPSRLARSKRTCVAFGRRQRHGELGLADRAVASQVVRDAVEADRAGRTRAAQDQQEGKRRPEGGEEAAGHGTPRR